MPPTSSHLPRTTIRRTADERRQDVLDAAVVEFASMGYYGGSTERIAAAAGISQPYVLRLFGTKKALFLAAFDRVCTHILQTWRNALAVPHTQQDHRLFALGAAFIPLVDEIDSLRLVLQAFSSAEDDEIRAATHRWLREMFTWVWEATGASFDDVRQYFSTGMMLMVAASIRAVDEVPTEPWARAFLTLAVDEHGNLSPPTVGACDPAGATPPRDPLTSTTGSD